MHLEIDGGGGQLHPDAGAGDGQAVSDADRRDCYDYETGDGRDGADGGGAGGVGRWRGGVEGVRPGDKVTMAIELITPVAMEKELRFAIREGGRTVGAGVATEITE